MSQRISTSLAVGFCALLLFAEVGFAQKNNPTVWPYGGVPDKSRKQDRMTKVPLNFKSVADFKRATFYDVVYFEGAKFDDVADFSEAAFHADASFLRVIFDSVADFSGANFESAFFNVAKFHDIADFTEAKFKDVSAFGVITFADVADFSRAEFDEAIFSEAKFSDVADFSAAIFNGSAHFVQTRFRRTVDFMWTDFRQGVDFRQTYFDSVQTLYLENIIFPEGKLRFYWHQFQGKDSLRIKLRDVVGRQIGYPPPDNLKAGYYTRIEIIYHRLRDNFLAQGDNASADAVMYELEWQRKEILKEFWWNMYGFFFGWGYQSWRFLLFVVLPTIMGFAVLWYLKYYEVLQKVIFKTELKDASSLTKKQGDLLQKIGHSIFFSSSVLLGIRFKKVWFIKHRYFLYWASLEWALGIGLIVMFALLVKGARFGFIRDLLGF